MLCIKVCIAPCMRSEWSRTSSQIGLSVCSHYEPALWLAEVLAFETNPHALWHRVANPSTTHGSPERACIKPTHTHSLRHSCAKSARPGRHIWPRHSSLQSESLRTYLSCPPNHTHSAVCCAELASCGCQCSQGFQVHQGKAPKQTHTHTFTHTLLYVAQSLKAVAANAAKASKFIKAESKSSPAVAPPATSSGNNSAEAQIEYNWDVHEHWENLLHVADEEVPVDRCV
eukprot:1139077-Pelagomonas_calceolata.AAC.20